MGLRGLAVVVEVIGGFWRIALSLSFMFMSVIGWLDGLLLYWREVGLGVEEELLLLSGEGRRSLVLLGRESGSLWIIILVGNS